MSFPRYESYKDSGVEWLGEVPAHWEVKRLKHNLRLLTEKTDRRENPVALENIESWSGRFIPTETTFDGEGTAFESGDILFGKLRPYLAKAYLAEGSGEAVGDFHVLRPITTTESRFSQYQILNREFIAIVDGSTFGAKMPRVSWDFLGNMVLTAPPVQEQQSIAAFLDRETTKIDTLIAEQKRLIELLKEKRQAVISHAVSKGLNPDAPMKDSGIEWLGEVPEHWEVKRLKSVLSEPLMYGANEAADDDNPENPRFVRITDISDSGSLRDDTFRSLPRDIAKPYLLTDGDVLLARSGATVGKTFIYRNDWGECCFAGYLIRARLDKTAMKPSLFYFCCQTTFYWQFINSSQIQATIQNVSAEKYANLFLPCPPLDEQNRIVAYINCETAKLDTLTAEAKRGIELLQERRTALISAAVTGKIDVRGLVSTALPEEAAA